MNIRVLMLLLAISVATSCATQTTVIKADLTKGEGAYVLAFIADNEVRARVERELVSALTAKGFIAHASSDDIPDIASTSREAIIDGANAKKTVSVLVVNQVAPDASDSVVADPRRVSPLHPDLQAFYEYAKTESRAPRQGEERVWAEINLFMLDGQDANLFWSGTAWSMADGQGGAAREIGALVADQLVQARQQILGN